MKGFSVLKKLPKFYILLAVHFVTNSW